MNITLFVIGITILLVPAVARWWWRRNTWPQLVPYGGEHGKGDLREKRRLFADARERLKAMCKLLWVWISLTLATFGLEIILSPWNWHEIWTQLFAYGIVLFAIYWAVARPMADRLAEYDKNMPSRPRM